METQTLTHEIGTKKQETSLLNSSLAQHANKGIIKTPTERRNEAKMMLIKSIDTLTPADICLSDSKQVQGLQILLIDISRHVNMAHLNSNEVVSIAQFARNRGENMVAKVIIICIKSFCDSIMVARKMTLADYLECANIFLEKHKHESIDDILVALKEAKASGRKDYGGFGSQDVFAIFNEHLDRKITFRENQHRDKKTQTKDWETTQMVSENSEIRTGIQKIRNAEREAISEKTPSMNLQTELDDLCLTLPTIDLDILQAELQLCRVRSVSFERVCLISDELERRRTDNPAMESRLLKKVQGNYLLTMKGIEEKKKYQPK